MEKIDAAVYVGREVALIFCGTLVFAMDTANKLIQRPPESVTTRWKNWPTNWDRVDAAFFWPGDYISLIRGDEMMIVDYTGDKIVAQPRLLSHAVAGENYPQDIVPVSCAFFYAEKIYLSSASGAFYARDSQTENWAHAIDTSQVYDFASPYDAVLVNPETRMMLCFKGAEFLTTNVDTWISGNAEGKVYNITDPVNGIQGLPVYSSQTRLPRDVTSLENNQPLLQAVSSNIKTLSSQPGHLGLELKALVKSGDMENPRIATIGRTLAESQQVQNIIRAADRNGESGVKSWSIGAVGSAGVAASVEFMQGVTFDINPAPGNHNGLRRYAGFTFLGGSLGLDAGFLFSPFAGGINWYDSYHMAGWSTFAYFAAAYVGGGSFTGVNLNDENTRSLSFSIGAGIYAGVSGGRGYTWDEGGLYY